MRMSGLVKSLAALVVAGVTYVDHNLGPLFWVLLALAGFDLLANIHKDHSVQFRKLGSVLFALGAPGFIATNSGHLMNPEVLKVLVAILVIAYIQVVAPQVLTLLGKIKWSANPATNQAIVTYTEDEVKALLAKATQDATKIQSGGGGA